VPILCQAASNVARVLCQGRWFFSAFRGSPFYSAVVLVPALPVVGLSSRLWDLPPRYQTTVCIDTAAFVFALVACALSIVFPKSFLRLRTEICLWTPPRVSSSCVTLEARRCSNPASPASHTSVRVTTEHLSSSLGQLSTHVQSVSTRMAFEKRILALGFASQTSGRWAAL